MSGNRRRTPVILVAVTIIFAVLASTGVAVAGDQSGVFATEPREVKASAGDEVTIRLTLQTQADIGGYGLESFEYTVQWDPEVLTLLTVEHGPYLGADGDDIDTYHDRDEGALSIRQEIKSSEDGVWGEGATATVTLKIAEDAPPGDIILRYTDATGTFVSGHPLSSFTYHGTIVVDGGGEKIEPPGISESDDGVEVTTADEVDRDVDAATDSDSTPGFGPMLTISALLVAVGIIFKLAT